MNDFERIAEIFNQIAETSGRNAKIDILESNIEDEQLQLTFRLAYDPYIKFNVARVELAFDDLPVRVPFGHAYTFKHFLDDLDKLVQREVTGHDALNWVTAIYKTLPYSFQPYLEKILQKDLKIGVSTQTINKVWDGLIPEFKLGLCERWKKVRSRDLEWPMYAEPKIDGVRVIAFVNQESSKVEMMSRSGLRYNNFKVIEDEILKTPVDVRVEPRFVLDGEIIDETFQGIMNNARRLYDVNCDNAIFHIWDILPMDEFLDESCSYTQKERKIMLANSIIMSVPHLRVHPYKEINSLEEIKPTFEEYYSSGYEGVILKNPESKYVYSAGTRRGKAWLKYKIQDYNKETGVEPVEYSVMVTGAYPGDKNTKFENVLGGFTYTGYARLGDGVRVKIEGRIGGGYKDSQRSEFWERRDSLVGSILDIEAQEVTTNEAGGHSLRFPVFQRFRPDLTLKDIENDA